MSIAAAVDGPATTSPEPPSAAGSGCAGAHAGPADGDAPGGGVDGVRGVDDRLPPRLVPAGATIAINAAVTFVMFTVSHDAIHHAISSTRWLNGCVGRLAWLLVVPIISFPTYAFLHIEHHRHANDDANDPDAWASHSRWWQMPLRWPFPELMYSGSSCARCAADRNPKWPRPWGGCSSCACPRWVSRSSPATSGRWPWYS